MDAEANNNNGDQIDVGILNADESNEQHQQPSGESATAGGENVVGAAAEDNDDSNSYGGEEEPSSLYDVCEYLYLCHVYPLEYINILLSHVDISHNNFSCFCHMTKFYLFPVCVSYLCMIMI